MRTQRHNLSWLGWASSAAVLLVAALATPSRAQPPNPGMRTTLPPGTAPGNVEGVPPGTPLPSQGYPANVAPNAVPQHPVTPPEMQPNARVWTLEQLTQLAEQSSPAIAKARAEIQSARGAAVQAGLYPNPDFDTNNPEFIAGQFTNLNVGIIQEVVVKGKKRLDQSAAEQAAVQAELAYIKARFDTLTDIRTQFYSVLAAERRMALQWDLVQIAAATRRAAEQRVQALQGTETDVLLLTVELQRAEIAARNYQTVWEGSKRKLAATIGIPELPIAALQGDLFGPLPAFDEETLRQFILVENSEVQSARIDVNRNRLLLRRAEVEPYPNIVIGPTFYSGIFPNRSPPQFGFTVVFPIPTWDRNQGNIQARQGDVRVSTANVGVVQNNLLGETANTLAQHRAARQRAERIGREILPNTQKALHMTRSGYDNGLFDISTLLQAQRSLIETNKGLIDALESAWTTGANLAGVLQQQQFP